MRRSGGRRLAAVVGSLALGLGVAAAVAAPAAGCKKQPSIDILPLGGPVEIDPATKAQLLGVPEAPPAEAVAASPQVLG